jgi:hypothetical protein
LEAGGSIVQAQTDSKTKENQTTVRYHFPRTRMGLIKRQTLTVIGENVETLEPLALLARM